MKTESTAVALVGAGAWGRNLLRNLASMPEARLAWVCDPSEAARAAAPPEARVAPGIEPALDDPRVRGVVIATNAGSHHQLALAALEADKDVLVEKPLTLSAEHAAGLCAIAEQRGRILMVGHLLLYHPAVEALKKLVDAGDLGAPLYLYAQRLNLGIVRRDENAWWSLAPHDIALANHLLGEGPASIVASGTSLTAEGRAGAHDVVFATMSYPGGRLAHVHVSWLDPHKTRRLTLVGSRRMAVFDDASADEKLVVFDKGLEPPHTTTYADGVRVRTGDIRIPAVRMEEPLRRECRAFLRAIVTREPPLTDGRSGLAVVRVLEAGARSLAASGAPVAVSS